MKTLATTIFVGLLLCTSQAFALELTNNTKATIKTKLHEFDDGAKVYTLTVDGKPVCLFDLFSLAKLLEASDDEILAAMRNNPSFPLMPNERVVFEYNEICSRDSSLEKGIGVHVSGGEEDGFFCLDLGDKYPYNQVYFADEIEIPN